ncbi:sensor histidine kinase [Acaryochloris marina]|uniref:histidine kinase n=1 Tax=Acaryochloris marina (strain MBIC 11017) TaxID=329726 RepID=B0C9B9_ACAM1|nr:HAMP domain-containing sensor histidine kinase [Acaryochloris marina]ABW27800.1 two-component sensor histidine kinase [Acaryochloris marina MBIC11017]BDM82528.1 two-component sensor histidine kinase [Acaryochloris marina MBIC10699]
MFQTTRRRLALWYTGVTAILLLVFASGFYLYVRGTLIERVDDTLSHVVEVVQRSLVVEASNADLSPLDSPFIVNLEASFGDPPDAVDDDRIDLEWFSAEGDLLWSTLSEVLEVPIRLGYRGETVEIADDYLLRQLTQRVMLNGNVLGYLRVSHPWFEVTKPARQLFIDLSLGTSLLVGLVAMTGWFLSGLAIEPIQDSYQHLKQFTADASHELRNPIALIQTNVQVALADPELEMPEQRQQLEVIERLTQRLGRLVDDLLFLARQDSGMLEIDYQPCPLDAVLMEVVEDQRALATSKGVHLHLHLEETGAETVPSEEPFSVIGDYDQLVRLFTNLVSNGIQYTPAEGRVRVTLKQSLRQGIPYLKAMVEDEGLGIPAEAIPHVFDRFYRADPARQRSLIPATQQPVSSGKVMGTGLGLAIAQAICHNHQGQMSVSSRLQQGTLFTVTLPQQLSRKIDVKSAPSEEINQLP